MIGNIHIEFIIYNHRNDRETQRQKKSFQSQLMLLLLALHILHQIQIRSLLLGSLPPPLLLISLQNLPSLQ